MTLERGYRRLLACFPWEHRRRYEQEMLGVLLDDANPGQRRPSAREVLDLLQGAARARVRYAVTDYTDQRWREAVAVLSLLAPLAMLAYTARPVLLDLGVRLIGPWETSGSLLWHSGPRAAAWTVVVSLAFAGYRAAAAATAWLGAGLEGVRTLAGYPAGFLYPDHFSAPGYLPLQDLWAPLLALVAAAALTAAPGRLGRARLGRRRTALLAGATLLGSVAPTIGFLAFAPFGPWHHTGSGAYSVWIFGRAVTEVEALLLGLSLVLGLCTVLSLPAPVRRRVLALLAPLAAVLSLTRVGFTQGGYPAGALGGTPIGALPPGLLALALVPPLTLAIAVVLVRRREQTLRLLALGRAADRQLPAGTPSEPYPLAGTATDQPG